jgi:hypothetical protein
MSLLTTSIESTHLTRWNFGLGALTLLGVFAIALALILPWFRSAGEPMGDHKFKIGQFVNYRPRVKSVGAGVYQIAQLMPSADDEPQYRIKSETEAHLRSAMESELSHLNRLWHGNPAARC